MSIKSNGKSYNTFDELFDDIDKEFHHSNPIGYWIDHTLFKGNGFLGYAPHYSLSHPWKPIELGIDQIVYAWERVFKGYDRRVIWSIDYYLTEHIPIWLKELKEKKQGVPVDCFDIADWDEQKSEYKDGALEKANEKYNNILDKIIEGFEAQKRIEDESLWKNDPEFEELNNKFIEGFDLFKSYYTTLWD